MRMMMVFGVFLDFHIVDNIRNCTFLAFSIFPSISVCLTPPPPPRSLEQTPFAWVPARASFCRDLEAEHSETQLEKSALALLKPLREEPAAVTNELAAEAVDALKTYAESLEIHLEKEERALVATWLNLDPDQYAKYRTYLVGKYRLAY